jgi:hypothetical protein
MSQERAAKPVRIHLGQTKFINGRIENVPPIENNVVDFSRSPKPADAKKNGLLAPILHPIAFWTKSEEPEFQEEQLPQNVVPFPNLDSHIFEMAEDVPSTISQNIISFVPNQEIVIPENNIAEPDVTVAVAKGVRLGDKLQAKRALEAITIMNNNSRPDEQLEVKIIPFRLRDHHNYQVEEYDADKVPMMRQGITRANGVKETDDGSVVAFQKKRRSNIIMLPDHQTSTEKERLALITNKPTSMVIASENAEEQTEISMAVVIEELGGGLELPEGQEKKIIQPPHDYWNQNGPCCSYAEDYGVDKDEAA